MEIDTENIEIIDAVHPDISEKKLVLVEYLDIAGLTKSVAISIDDGTDISKKVLEKFSEDDIVKNTKILYDENKKKAEDFLQYLEWRDSGKISANDIKEVEVEKEMSLELLENTSVEDLFKIKLNIFDLEEFQEFEDRDLRSKIRKSKTLPELMHHYYDFLVRQDS